MLQSYFSRWRQSLCLLFPAMFLGPVAGLAGSNISIVLDPILNGLTNPVYLTHAGDGTGRLFIVEQAGRILIYQNGSLLSPPFLDIRGRVTSGGEMGLLNVVFHPDFKNNRRFFVNYTDRRPNLKSFIAEYRASSDDPNHALLDEKILLEFDQPFENHKGGQLQFGPDGYLYIGTGDGGSEGDPLGNGQNKNTLLGKILRVDVDGNSLHVVTNPFTDGTGLPEIWAYGLRNPWRFSFDRLTGRLFAGDVGQDKYEEIDLITRGSNYGWNIMEGDHCYSPATGCTTTGLIPPIDEYSHDLGNAVIGGYVYRGRKYPELDGLYFFGDFGSSRIWSLTESNRGTWDRTELLNLGKNLSSFGEDERGELYVVDYGGSVYRLRSSASPGGVDTRILVPSTSKTGDFTSTLTIVNRDTAPAKVRITAYRPDGSTNKVAVVALPSYGMFETHDVLGYLGLPVGSYGPLTVEPLQNNLLSVSSEVRSLQKTAGFLPGLPAGKASQERILPEAIDTGQPGQKGTFRSNLGINNLGSATGNVEVSLVGQDGTLMGSTAVVVPPGGMVQVNQVARMLVPFSPTGKVLGYLRLVSDQPVHAWLSKLDNETDDPSLEEGIGNDLQETGTKLLIPSVANTSRFKSLLTIVNRDNSANPIRLSALDISGNVVATLNTTIPAKGFHRSTDILNEMAIPGEFFGSIWIESLNAGLLSAVSEVRSPEGRTGGFFPAVNPASGTLRRVIGGVVDSGERGTPGTFRTNVGINNLGPLSARISLKSISADGTTLGTLGLEVPAGGMMQIDDVMLATRGRFDDSEVYLRIFSDQPVHAWASKINNETDDPSILMSDRWE